MFNYHATTEVLINYCIIPIISAVSNRSALRDVFRKIKEQSPIEAQHLYYARFTLAEPTPRLASDGVGGKSGQTIQCRVGTLFTLAEWRVMSTFASVGTVEEFYLLQLPLKDSCIVYVRLLIGWRRRVILNMINIGRQPPDGLPMRPRQLIPGQEPIHIGRTDSIGAQSGHNRGTIGAQSGRRIG